MATVDEIIASIPNDQMETGYREQRTSLERQLALNAAAYRLQETMGGDKEARKASQANIGEIIKQLKASIDDIDKRLNGASEALKS